MYKVTYIVLASYSGLVYFVYIPAMKFMFDNFGQSTTDITFFSSIVYFTWVLKPVFGYLSDYYPIQKKRITPYVTLACLMNLVVLTIASRVNLSKSYPAFITVIFFIFMGFSMIDSAARRQH